MCPGGRRVHSGWLGWRGCALGVSGLILGHSVVVGGRWVQGGAPWESLGSLVVVGFTRVRPACSQVHSTCLCSRGYALVVVGGRWVRIGVAVFIRVPLGSLSARMGQRVHSGSLGFNSGAPKWLRVHLGSRGFTLACLGVTLVILVRLGSIDLAQVSFWFAIVHSGALKGHRVHSDLTQRA